jgi:LDH2 family malate/lactate/ureidoglycolate dehydrogenase
MLDLLVAGLSGGRTVAQITAQKKEYGLSQIFICINAQNISPSINDRVTGILDGERFSLAKPTQTHLDDYAIASQELAAQSSKLKKPAE